MTWCTWRVLDRNVPGARRRRWRLPLPTKLCGGSLASQPHNLLSRHACMAHVCLPSMALACQKVYRNAIWLHSSLWRYCLVADPVIANCGTFKQCPGFAIGYMQVYRGMLDAARGIVAAHGVAGLYRGLSITLLEIVPYAALQFGVYDALTAAVVAARRRGAAARVWLARPAPLPSSPC